jgi:hypothetical protein
MICLILCLQQTSEIDNLTVSWGKVLGCVVCRFHVADVQSYTPDEAQYINCLELSRSQRASTFEVGSFSYWFDKPWFHTEGRLAAMLIIPSSCCSQLGSHLHAINLYP